MEVIVGDALAVLSTLPAESVQCVVTSPPYWGLRDYGVAGQLGAEQTPHEYVDGMVDVFRQVRRVLRADGTLWLNLGDSYAANRTYQAPSTKGGAKHAPAQGFDGSAMRVPDGLKPKDLIGIPWRVAFALQADGWYLRSDIIWHKPNPMPSSVRDRPTTAHEYLFLFAKSNRYYYDADAIKERGAYCGKQLGIVRGKKVRALAMGRAPSGNEVPGADALAPERRNKRDVWTIATRPYKGAHFATFPPALVEPCLLAGSKPGDVVLDPFAGSGTTGAVAVELQRDFIGIELNPEYARLAEERIDGTQLRFVA